MGFSERLKELEAEKDTQRELLNFLGIKDDSIFYAWINNVKGVTLDNAFKIAKFYSCSLDYLFDREKEYKKVKFIKSPIFSKQLEKVLKECKISKYKLCKENNISTSSIHNWIYKGIIPNMSSVEKIANYLQVSIDYLVGLE